MELGFYPERSEFRAMAEKGNLIPVCLEVLADTETPVSALAKIYDGHGPVFLLESMEGGERWGRYSFLGNSATRTVRVFRDEVEIESGPKKERIAHHGDPLTILRSIMAQYKPVKLARLPRFWGGMVGFFTYEFVSFLEAIPNRLPPDVPMAHFILPGQLFIFDNVRHTLTLVAYGLVENGEADDAYDRALETLEEMKGKLSRAAKTAVAACGRRISTRSRGRTREIPLRGCQNQRIHQGGGHHPGGRFTTVQLPGSPGPLVALPRSALYKSVSIPLFSPF